MNMHTDACEDARTDFRIRIQADTLAREMYAAKWPKFCTSCDAAGQFTSYTYDEGQWTDVCGSCLEEGHCPRCGEDWPEESEETGHITVCPHCGWDEENPDMAPHVEYPLDAWERYCICGLIPQNYMDW